MAPTHLLLRLGELFLKGGNQAVFLQALSRNIKIQVGSTPSRGVRGRLFLPGTSSPGALQQVFGLVSSSPAVRVEARREDIQEAALRIVEGKTGLFRIRTQRSDKRFPLTSPELNQQVGWFLEQKTALRYAPTAELLLEIEINTQGAFLFTETFPGRGGLPVGVEGKVLLLLETKEAVLAGILMMKRGCRILPVARQEPQKEWIAQLQSYSPFILTTQIISSLDELELVARRKKARVLAVGERWGEMQMQCSLLPVLRPLYCFSEQEILGLWEKYDKG